jgi:hypothetical protein
MFGKVSFAPIAVAFWELPVPLCQPENLSTGRVDTNEKVSYGMLDIVEMVSTWILSCPDALDQ